MKNLRTVGLLSLLVAAPSLFAERSTLSKLVSGTTLGGIATIGYSVVSGEVIPNVLKYVKTSKAGALVNGRKRMKVATFALQTANLVAAVATTNAAARDMDKQDSDETKVNVRRTTLASAALTAAALYFGKI